MKVRIVLDKDGAPKIHKCSSGGGSGKIFVEARFASAKDGDLSVPYELYSEDLRKYLRKFSDKFLAKGKGRCDGVVIVKGDCKNGSAGNGGCREKLFSVPVLFS